MCGPENSSRPRGGALAVLHASPSHASTPFNIDLYLQTPGKPSSDHATRATIIPSTTAHLTDLEDLHVFISTTGDLTKSLDDCEVLRHVPFSSVNTGDRSSRLDVSFENPLSLQIGGNGVMGRRVSLCSSSTPSSSSLIAEGIVGHNFLSQEQMEKHSQAPF